MEQVTWKVKLFKDADAQKVYEELGEDNLTPEEILEKAKDPDSELHKCFEWDDSKAAHLYRLQQARTIVQNLVFVPEKKNEPPVRVFYNLTFEKAEYHPTKLILKKPDEYEALLQKALGELRAFQAKYQMISELQSIFEMIDKL